MSSAHLDPYTSQAINADITPQQKINGLKEIIQKCETSMMTTRSSSGQLHSRAMSPVKSKDGSSNDLHLVFLGNNVSGKFDEIRNDDHVNVSFYDHSSTNWASIAGTARVTKDREFITKYWSPMTGAWFGDLGDGVHKGNVDDPRVSAIEVVPKEIRYWVANKGKVGRTIHIAVGAATGKGQAPGELRTITPEEIQLVEGLNQV